MSVLGTISLSGLTTTTSDYVQTVNLEVSNALIVDNGATITLPNHSISDTALSTNIPFLNTPNTFTNNNTFNTTATDGAPVTITNTTSNKSVSFCADTSASGYNPYCLAGDGYIGASSDLVVGKQNSYSSIRFTDTDMTLYSNVQQNYIINDFPCLMIDQNTFNLDNQFLSNWNSTTEYENKFVGDIWTQKGLSTKNGLFIQNDIVEGSTTYAIIDSTGNAVFASTVSPLITSTATAKDIATITTNNSLGTGYIKLYPNTNLSSFNPLVKNNDCLLLSDGPTGSGLTIGRATTNATGMRLDASTVKFAASGAIQFWLSGATSGTYSGFDSVGQLVCQDGASIGGSSFLCQTTTNQFVNDITCDNKVIGIGGIYVNNTLGVTQASINSTGVITAPSANITTITTTTQATADNSTKCATTAYVKNQGYCSTTSANTFTANQTIQSTTVNAQTLKVRSSGLITNNPFVFISPACTATAYNPIVQANDSLICLSDSTSSPTTSLVVAVHSGAYSGIRIGPQNSQMYSKSTLNQFIWDKSLSIPAFQLNATNNVSNSRLDCTAGLTVSGGPITPPQTNVSTTSAHMGYQINPTISIPTGSTAQNICSILFDGTTNVFGTYIFEYHIILSATTGCDARTNLSTTNLQLTGNYQENRITTVASTMSLHQTAVIRVLSTQTWYLNFQVSSGTYTYTSGLFNITRVS